MYRLQKVLEFRIHKRDEQLIAVQIAQQAVFIAQENIRKNEEEIQATKQNMRKADPMMYETYDKYLIHLWDKARQLEEIRVQAQQKLDEEIAILAKLEQGVKVLEKHKEKNKELWLEEEKKAELKLYSEQGVVRFFRQKQEKLEEEDREILRQLEQIDK
ncbi:hypothetical protein II810_04540 [bacterium]|nr:hypothetical protein [bacterium]